jgi:hypothetical protein
MCWIDPAMNEPCDESALWWINHDMNQDRDESIVQWINHAMNWPCDEWTHEESTRDELFLTQIILIYLRKFTLKENQNGLIWANYSIILIC